MPYSTGSTDSDYCTIRDIYNIEGSTNFDIATSSITGTDDEEYRSGQRVTVTDKVKSSRPSKTRRLRKKTVVTPDSSSSCNSEVGSLAGEEERRRTLSFDDIIKRIYVYFQSMLVTIRREQQFCEQIGGLMADVDARWGYIGQLNGWLDPSGCFAPPNFGDVSKRSAFRGCWAVPHPSVYFSLLATNIKDYLAFLQRLYPGIVGRNGAGACSTRSSSTSTPIDEASLLAAQRARGTDMGMPEEMLPILMRLMQQMGVQSPSSGGQSIQIDDSLRQEEKMNQQVQLGTTQPHGMWGTGQSAVKQQLNAQVSQKNHTQAYGQPPSQTVVQNSTQEFYSAVVARQSSKLSGDHATKTTLLSRRTQSLQSPNVTGSPPTHATRLSKDQSVRSIPSDLPLSHDIGVMENEAEFGDDMEQISNDLIVLSVSSSRDDIITPCGESGYHSESSPPLPIEQKQRDASPTPVSPVVSCSSKSGEKTNRVPVSPSVCAPSSSKEVSSFAAAATNLSPSLSASISTPPCPPPSGPVSSTGQFEVSKMDVLSEEIWHYHNSVTQTDTMLNRKLHLRDMLYYSICPVFPMCGLYVVGSSLNGFGNNSSDMDLCLMITNKDLDQKTDAVVVLNMILSTLQQIEWVAHQKLILAKVPILRIKFAAPFADITVDLNANNSVAIKNTHLLCYYSSFDWRVRPLVSVVKEWAKRKGINDANRSSFTSYSLVLMVIHFLQCGAEPSVLPSLQQLYPRRFSSKCDVRALNVTLPLGPPTADEWQFSEKATLGELLIGFLDYYANKFDYDRDAISVRLGKRMDRAIIARQRPNAGYQNNGTNWRSQWRCICIEEPFTYSNTAHSIYDEMVFDAIKSALREAHLELDSTRDLQRLLNCKPISVNAPIGGAMVFATSYEGVRTPSATSLGTATVSNNNVSTRLSIVGSGSASSLSTAHSDASSSASSTSGEEQDHDRLRELPPSPPFKSIPSRSQWRRPNRHGSLTTVSSRQ